MTIMAADDDSDVPESGGVFTFGKSKFNDNIPGKFWVRNDPVLEVACGDEHTALIAGSGRVFTFGANDWSQLGLGDMKLRSKPCCVKSIKSQKICIVACGRSSTYVATVDGKLLSYGGNTDGQLGLGMQESSINKPQLVETISNINNIKMLSAGADHAALLTEDGKLYMWGGGSEGQLGLGDKDDHSVPTMLKFKTKISAISCGYYHTAFCTVDGELYTFGEMENGKLGLGENIKEAVTPQLVSGIDGKVFLVACGGSHTVAVTLAGRVFSFGDGSNGQLGHGNIQLEATKPQEIMGLRNVKIVYASCGENHTALVSRSGVLFTFGDGRHGKLALGEENFANQFKPMAVSRFEGFHVTRVACGGCHMLVIARPSHLEDKEEDEEVVSSDAEEEDMKPKRLLSLSQDIDLSGSFQARSRRREKNDTTLSSGRTLPPLSTITGRSTLVSGSATLPNVATGSLIHKSSLPPLKRPGHGSFDKQESTHTEIKTVAPVASRRIDKHCNKSTKASSLEDKTDSDNSTDMDDQSKYEKPQHVAKTDSEDDEKPIKSKTPPKKKESKDSKHKLFFGKKAVVNSESEEENEDKTDKQEKEKNTKRSIFSWGSQRGSKKEKDKAKDEPNRKKNSEESEDSDSEHKKNGAANKHPKESAGTEKDKKPDSKKKEDAGKSSLCSIL